MLHCCAAPRCARCRLLDQVGPFDAGLHIDKLLFQVEMQHLVEVGQIEQHGVGAKLLASLGMPSAADADGPPLARGSREWLPESVLIDARPHDPRDVRSH